MRFEVLERLRSPVERSDILRLEILYAEGGVYVDTDLECLRPMDDELGEADFVATYFKPDRITNTFLASVPGHPILERALAETQPREFYGFDKEVAGPPFLDRMVKGYGTAREDIKVLDPALLFAETPETREGALAIHHMSRTWKDAAGLRQSMLRAEERLEKAKLKLDQERRRHAATQKKLAKLEKKRAKSDGTKPQSVPTELKDSAEDVEAGPTPEAAEPRPGFRERLRMRRPS